MSTTKWPNWLRGLLVVAVCVTFAAGAWAQSMTAGGITGTVVDQTGAAVPNAAIAIRNVDTNSQQSTSSDAEGRFRVAGLTPGTYAVEAKAANFAPYKADGVVVQIGAVTTLELRLGITGKAETVEVTGEMAMVNTVQADFASNINQGQIDNLPINGRRWSNFALLAPGAGMDGTYGLISFRGMTGLMNNSTIDGGDNNQAFMSEERGRTRASYVVSQGSVREFQVNTSNYSAEYGRAAGAVVNTVTKSGGNSFHGMAFYNIRDNALGAYNPLTTRTVKDPSTGQYVTEPYKPEDRRQQFGGNLGGPLAKDKLFFFFNYDGQRWNMPGIASPRSANQTKQLLGPASSSELRTLAQRMYNLPSSGLGSNPTAAQTAAATTAFNAGLDFLQQTTGIQPRNSPQDIFFPRLDWRISQNNTFFASYNRMRRTATAMVQSPAVVNRGVGDWGDDMVKVDVVNARLSSAISTSLSNELRFSWGRDFESQRSTPAQNPVEQAVAALATNPSYGGYLPQTYIASIMYVGRPYYTERYAYPDEHRFQFADTAAWAKGKHLIKFGVDFSRVNDLMSFVNQAGGAYSYDYRTDFITDLTRITSPSTWHGVAAPKNYYSLNQGVGVRDWEFNTWDYAFFVQDDIRLHPRLTLNLGLRYEYEQMPEPQIPNPAFPLTQKMPSDKNNIGPRIGFAFDVFGDTKTVLRGGYGMYYGRIANCYVLSALNSTGLTDSAGQPLGQVNYYFTNSTTGAPTWPNVFAGTQAGITPDIAMFGPDAQNPQIHQADLIFEHEIARNTVLSVSYLMSLGRQLVNLADSNLADKYTPVTYSFYGGPFGGEQTVAQIFTKISSTQARPNPAYGKIMTFLTNVNSNYNALVAQVNRRMTNGLQFQFSYTWSHALDWGQESFTFTDNNSIKSFDIYHPQYDYGTSNYDVRHRFIANAVWQPQYFKGSGPVTKALLNGWSISPIFAFTSGRPYSEYMNGRPTMPSGSYYVVSSFNGSGGPNRLATLVGRNAWRMPWLQNIDLRLGRSFRVKEGHSVQVTAEAFNLFNHMNVFYMNNTLYRMCSTSTTPSCPSSLTGTVGAGQVAPNTWIYDNTFGTVSGADSNLYRERQIQFGVRYTF